MQWLEDLGMLFFPCNCLVCGKRLPSRHGILCLKCEHRLPWSGFRDPFHNPVSRIFWGRAPVEAATSLFRFEKGSPYQQLLHELKYRGNRRVGWYLGMLLGEKLEDSVFSSCSLIVPVPIHPAKRRERGYNQSEVIAFGISRILHIPVESGLLRRRSQVRSQTSVGRYDRFLNVSGNFSSGRVDGRVDGCFDGDFRSQNILLVDDVVTTGATLEACSNVLAGEMNCRIFVATICHA